MPSIFIKIILTSDDCPRYLTIVIRKKDNFKYVNFILVHWYPFILGHSYVFPR